MATRADRRGDGPRIGVDAHILGSGKGGVEVYIRQLCQHLPGIAPQARFVFFVRRGYTPDWTPEPNAAFVHLPDVHLLAQRFLVLPALARRHRLDLLHVQRISPALAGCPVALSVHDIFPVLNPEEHPGLLNAFLRAMTGPSIRMAHMVLTVSEASKAAILTRYGTDPRKVRVIHNGVDASSFAPCAQAAPEGPPYALFIGAFEPRKNLEVSLRGFAAFLRSAGGRGARYVLVGGERQPGYRAHLEALVQELGVSEAVRFTGYIDDSERTGLLRGARLLLAPSSAEGFNLPPLEAMAVGVPVICSDIAVHRELFSSAAAFFTMDDPSALAGQLARLWPDAGAREAMGAAGRRLAGRFSWQASAREHWEAYASLVARR